MEPHVDAVVVDTTILDGGHYALKDGTHLVIDSETARRSIDLASSHGWVRRLSTPGWRSSTPGGSREAAIRASYLALLVGLASSPDVCWLTPYPRLLAAENKLRQAAHARRIGIPTPRTLVLSDPDEIPVALGGEIVVKPLGPGHFADGDREASVVWAQSLRRDDPRLAALAGAPFLVQEKVAARRHLRVVTCKDQAWSCQLDAAGLPLDWRRSEEAHHSFTPASEPELERSALTLARDLDLGYSSQDWIDAGDRMVFIDLNPAGQWLFLPEPVRSEVTDAVADHLAGA